MVENNYHVLEEDKEVYSDIWDKEKRALINYEVVDLLNEQEETINELKQRNQRQYNRLKELGDLILKKDWKTLKNIADEWEKQEELLQAEWGTYCENK